MLNERITEDIVREHFKKDKMFQNIIFEEQLSHVPRINKLLQNASKCGGGKGKPEFLLTVKEEKNLLIVIECKADVLKHESETGQNYRDYAVDGVLLYSSYLSKEFDTLAIAISGQTVEELKVSYFIQRKCSNKQERIFGNKLISLEDIIAGLHQDKVKRDEKYEELLDYSKMLNSQLHELKIKEDKRSLLVSGILIALQNKGFYRDYATISTPKILANTLVETIKEQLQSEHLQGDKIDKLINNYEFLKTHPSLTKNNKNPSGKTLKDLIDDIDENINGYARTYKYYDVLGQFYIEFLRYSNADKGLGIVLTPPHITELFCDLAELKTNDIVYDNCTGTAGFLVSAMQKMISMSGGDSNMESNIKQKQLYGTEYQPEIYPLAVSNMFLHGDGKSNIFSDNCFNSDLIDKIKSKKPTVAFLNPPYKADKSRDIEEFEFILNALECLQPHGRCIAIIPMSCVLAQRDKRLRLKEKLLRNHTLKAVLSMPNELFFNSKVGISTCIIVIEAHIPHSPLKNTFFGYYKEDGFTKNKTKGRYDYDKKWNKLREEWIDLFLNNQEKEGLSVLKKVSAIDEWCAEAYMKTPKIFSAQKTDFEKTIKDYCVYLLANNERGNIYKSKVKNNCAPVNIENWKEFKISDLFQIEGSTTTPPSEIEISTEGKYPYVTTQATNNGVGGKYDFYTEDGNILTIDSAVIGYTSYQKEKFSASDHVEKLIPNFALNPYNALFLTTVFNKEQFRYNYGRKASQKRLKCAAIKLPATPEGKPDWNYMENYIKSLDYSINLSEQKII